jgi:DNA-binding GntR family transcriptional regulator
VPPKPDAGDLRQVVAEMGMDDLSDALAFRLAVECGAAQVLAMSGLTEEKRAVLRRRLSDLNEAPIEDYRRLDTAFHLSIAELTGSTLLATACADARSRVSDLLNAIPMLQVNLDHAAVQHQAIVDAILSGDADAARRAVSEHLEGTAALLRAFLS